MCNYKKIAEIIESTLDGKLGLVHDAIAAQAAVTHVLEQGVAGLEKSVGEMKDAHVRFFEALINQEGMQREISHLQKENDTARKDLDTLYGLIRENENQSYVRIRGEDKDSYSRIFVILMTIFSCILGGIITSIIWAIWK